MPLILMLTLYVEVSTKTIKATNHGVAEREVLFLGYFLLLSAILGIWIFFGAAEGEVLFFCYFGVVTAAPNHATVCEERRWTTEEGQSFAPMDHILHSNAYQHPHSIVQLRAIFCARMTLTRHQTPP